MFNNSSSSSSNYTFPIDYNAWKYSYYAFYIFVIVFGTLINAWMLAALATSPEMRSSMRNRLVCMVLFNGLLRAVFISVLEILEVTLILEHGLFVPCGFGTFSRIMRFALMWVENWYVLILMVHYISTLLEFDPVKYLSARRLQIGSISILAGPWILSLIVGPAVLAHEFHKKYGVHSKGCVYYTLTSFKSLVNFGVTAPWFIKMALIVAILILNHRRKTRYSSMNASLVAPATHIDDVKAYVVLYLIVCVTQSILMARSLFKIKLNGFLASFIYSIISWFLAEIRCVIIPFAFICFEDIRSRVKTWKPWYRPAPGIDLTVQYNQTKEDGGPSV